MSKRVLVVDDEDGALRLIGIMLERGGYEVMKAQDAFSALEMVDNGEIPDMFILDVMMPEMDGIELCEVLTNRDDTGEIPVLILSARGDPDAVSRGLSAGADDYLLKPILHFDLITKIEEIFAQHVG